MSELHPLSRLLQRGIAELRDELGEAFARIGVLTPSPASCALAHQSLAAAGSFVQVRFLEPEGLLAELGEPPLVSAGGRPEPPGWLLATVLDLGRGLAERVEARDREAAPYAEALRHPSWAPAFAAAIERLEGAEVGPDGLRAVAAVPGADLARAELLRELLEGVAARRAEAGLYGRADVYRAARDLDLREASRSVARDEAYVVLGDRALPPLACDALARWLDTRPGRRVALAPTADVPAAGAGLRAAAARLPSLDDRAAPEGSLAQLQSNLHSPGPSAEAPRDGAVELRWALDERREAREAVRAVLDAVRGGVPLDRIAVALPSAEQADVLTAELRRARIPFVALLGPPLARSPAAGLLLELVSAAPEALDLPRLHRLLLHPEQARGVLGAEARRSRRRWRRLLAKLGPVSGLSAIGQGLERAHDEAGADDRAALGDLRAAVQTLRTALEARPERAPWSEHLQAFRQLAETWLRPGESRSRILEVLESFGEAPGPELGRDDARALLARRLEERAALSGDLRDPAVRVLPPFELFAAAADVVIVTGLAHGTFPARSREDPVLADHLLESLDARLEGSEMREDLERRRFAAAVSAARRQLVLLVPRAELMSGRPLAPGRLVLDAARALGWAQSFRALEGVLVPADTDAAGTIRDPERAVHAAEHRLAKARQDPARAIDELGASPRRLLALHRARDRHRAAGGVGLPCAYTGRVDPQILRSPIGEDPLPLRQVIELAEKPSSYFFRRMLGAWPPRRLPGPRDPFDRDAALRKLVEGLEALAEAGASRPIDELEAWLANQRATLPPEVASALAELEGQGLVQLRALLASELEPLEGGEVEHLGVPLAVPAGLRSEGVLCVPRPHADPQKKVGKKLDAQAALHALAVSDAGVDTLRVVGLRKGKDARYPRRDLEGPIRALLDTARALAEAGYFPVAERVEGGPVPRMAPFVLAVDPEHDPTGEPPIGEFLEALR